MSRKSRYPVALTLEVGVQVFFEVRDGEAVVVEVETPEIDAHNLLDYLDEEDFDILQVIMQSAVNRARRSLDPGLCDYCGQPKNSLACQRNHP